MKKSVKRNSKQEKTGESSRKTCPDSVHHESQVEWARRELGTPEVEGERSKPLGHEAALSDSNTRVFCLKVLSIKKYVEELYVLTETIRLCFCSLLSHSKLDLIKKLYLYENELYFPMFKKNIFFCLQFIYFTR